MDCREMVFMMAVIPANTPKLMAMATPNFSFFFICRPQINGQGMRARMMSMAAE